MSPLELENAIQRIILKNDQCIVSSHASGFSSLELVPYASNVDCDHIYFLASDNAKAFMHASANPQIQLLWDDRFADNSPRLMADGVCLSPTARQGKKILEKVLRRTSLPELAVERNNLPYIVKIQRFSWLDNHTVKPLIYFPKLKQNTSQTAKLSQPA